MTEQRQQDPAKAATLAQKIATILADQDSETRRRVLNAAMALLGDVAPCEPIRGSQRTTEDSDLDLANFFVRDEDLKPADNAQLCAAFHFSRYGPIPFSLLELRTIARDAGVVLPDRLDKTLNQATKNGKKLFQAAGKGAYKPTASASLNFIERWGVRPGRMAKHDTSTNGAQHGEA